MLTYHFDLRAVANCATFAGHCFDGIYHERSAPSKAIIGQDGWLYLTNDSNRTWDQFEGRLLLSDDEVAALRRELAARGAFMRQNSIHYRFVVAPNKESITPEKLPAGKQKAPKRLVDQVHEAAKECVHGVFLENFMMAHAERLAFYDKGDTHWNGFGAWHVSNHIMRGLQTRRPIEPIAEDDVRFHASQTVVGDLSNKFDPPISCGTTWAELKQTRTHCSFDNGISNHGHIRIWEGGDPDGPNIVIFGDSFAGAISKYFAHRARRLVRVHSSAIDREILFRERPEIVLSVTVERFLRGVPAPIADFSYKTDLRKKLNALDKVELQKTLAAMRVPQSGENSAYAADILCSAEI